MKEKLLFDVTLMDDTINGIYAKQRDNRKKIEELVYEMVDSKGGTINLKENIDDEYCYISYDGGVHPEYKSTVSANVCSVSTDTDYKGNKTFNVHLEDTEGETLDETYQAYRMNFDEVVDVFDFVKYKCYGTI